MVLVPDMPVLCWSVQLPADGFSGQILQYSYSVYDEQVLMDDEVGVLVNVNYDCTSGTCAESSSSLDNVCLNVATKLPQGASRIPIALNLIRNSDKSLFIPTESIEIGFRYRWLDIDEDCPTDDGAHWIAWIIVSILLVTLVTAVLGGVVFLYLKKRPDDKKLYQSS